MINIDVVCPIYKNINQIKNLYYSLLQQNGVKICNVVFPLTKCNNKIDYEIIDFMKDNNIKFFIETETSFSHSLTREKAIKEYCKEKFVVMLSQDVKFFSDRTISNLVAQMSMNENIAYSYGRQVAKKGSIEQYIKESNYPNHIKITTKENLEKEGLGALFSSDAFACYNREIFIKINGYLGYDVMMNEDQLFSLNLLENGYSKIYVPSAMVYHHHYYTLKKLYARYYQAGKFYSEVRLFDKYKKESEGMKLGKNVLIKALKHFNIPVLINFLPNMAARYLGLKKGYKKKGE